ncbi:hypothetical protein BJ956_002435 [Arthrobacter psychrochitiniphilus]|nr:hypothetical protein [Arthrobacter psychrochitiniphilus]
MAHPETDFYIVGMKSYGRAPTFLMATGYEQVRSVSAALSGDREAASSSVELQLPETGVCSTDLGNTCDAPAPSGCTPEPEADSCAGSRRTICDSIAATHQGMVSVKTRTT